MLAQPLTKYGGDAQSRNKGLAWRAATVLDYMLYELDLTCIYCIQRPAAAKQPAVSRESSLADRRGRTLLVGHTERLKVALRRSRSRSTCRPLSQTLHTPYSLGWSGCSPCYKLASVPGLPGASTRGTC